MASECIPGGAEFAAIGAGVALRESVLAFDVLVKHSLVLGVVRTGQAAPEGDSLHLLAHHLGLDLTCRRNVSFLFQLNTLSLGMTYYGARADVFCQTFG